MRVHGVGNVDRFLVRRLLCEHFRAEICRMIADEDQCGVAFGDLVNTFEAEGLYIQHVARCLLALEREGKIVRERDEEGHLRLDWSDSNYIVAGDRFRAA